MKKRKNTKQTLKHLVILDSGSTRQNYHTHAMEPLGKMNGEEVFFGHSSLHLAAKWQTEASPQK